MSSSEDAKSMSEENFDWNVENEIKLFEAMIGHKPVGINKHFHMACITEKFETLMGRPVSSDIIWTHLSTMFDLGALDKKESLPFPNEEEEFSLPESDYLDLINEKLLSKNETFGDVKEITKEGRMTPKVKDSVLAKESKKEKKVETDDSGSNNESDKKEMIESESDNKKGKSNKEEKTVVKTRGKRSLKDKKSDEESVQVLVPVGKKEEELSVTPSSSKKEKQVVGKRTLRSRADELSANKSVTPPPVKRGRRI